MKTIEHGINLGIAGDWVVIATCETYDDGSVSIFSIALVPDTHGEHYLQIHGGSFDTLLFDVLADELENDEKFIAKALES